MRLINEIIHDKAINGGQNIIQILLATTNIDMRKSGVTTILFNNFNIIFINVMNCICCFISARNHHNSLPKHLSMFSNIRLLGTLSRSINGGSIVT